MISDIWGKWDRDWGNAWGWGDGRLNTIAVLSLFRTGLNWIIDAGVG